MDSFAFGEGRTTARQLRKTVTAYSEGALQTALEHGCKDLEAVMRFLARRDNMRQGKVVRGGRKAARNSASRVTIMPRSKEWA